MSEPPASFYKDHFADLVEAMEKGEEMNPNWLEMDSTHFPFILNVHNPHKHRNYNDPCCVCKLKNCNNCHLPITKDHTLRAFLDLIMHKTKFNDNDNLFRSADDLK